jgi:UDP-N-acetylmuramate dehydrogenase
MNDSELLNSKLHDLAILDIGAVSFDEPLSNHNSWKIGGNADLFVEPETPDQVAELMRALQTESIPCVVIGQGTNLLFDDTGIRGVVIKIGAKMADMKINATSIIVQGGCWVPQLARKVMAKGLSGLEHCIGIPGTVGGLIAMNGGSQRKGIGENVVAITVVTRSGEIQKLSQADCCFAYRRSALQDSGAIVVEAELHCPLADQSDVRREMLTDLRIRRSKFPRKIPNCGSVFLSTAEMHASVGPPGKIIEDAGLKGTSIGQAEVSDQHANFIINRGGAKASDVLQLIRHIRQTVRQRIGFDLDCEVRYVSPEGKILPAHTRVDQG